MTADEHHILDAPLFEVRADPDAMSLTFVDRLGIFLWSDGLPAAGQTWEVTRVARDRGGWYASVDAVATNVSGFARDVPIHLGVPDVLGLAWALEDACSEAFPRESDVVTLRRSLAVAKADGLDARDLLDRARAEAPHARAAMGPFLDRLDPDAVAFVRGFVPRLIEPATYDLLDPAYDPDAPLLRALLLHPSLPITLIAMADRDEAPFRAAVAGGPDALRAALTAALAARSPAPGYPAACMRADASLGRLSDAGRAAVAQALCTRSIDGVHCVADELGTSAGILTCHLPPDWLPHDMDGWVALGACAPAVRHAFGEAGADLAATLLDARGDWPGTLRRLTAAHGRAPRALRMALDDVSDMVAAYRDQVVGPACGWDADADRGAAAKAVLTDGRRLRRILEVSRRWHAAAETMLDGLPRDGADRRPDSWPEAWPGSRFGGVDVSEVTTAAGLREEGASDGEGLAHCVGGHVGRCLSGASRVLSLRRASDGSRLSTAEVARYSNGNPAVLQHRGLRNAEPPPEAAAALDAYVADVAAGRLTLRGDALAAVWDELAMAGGAGYDAAAPGAWETMRDRWDPFLPRHLRGMTADEVREVVARTSLEPEPRRWRPASLPRPAALARPHGDRG